ncbi:tubulin epsilon and delta complex protein 1 [Megalops cyprinoides]|uniref:tubulin epsilon and delta complex protein 1 n=1 Tax=Megalops cyprinoides TaxID=118141 RepID=UPI0018655F20|nr:tubulin epsilon and delta complex protein 1 [Megalops cyprinoides]
MQRGKSVKVKEVIESLCKLLSALEIDSVPGADTFRRAKFNKEDAVDDLWTLLYNILSKAVRWECSCARARLVSSALWQCGYRAQWLQGGWSLMEEVGSRELLLALGWVMSSGGLLESLLAEMASGLETLAALPGVSLSAAGGGSVERPRQAEQWEGALRRLQWEQGKLRILWRSLQAAQRERAALLHQASARVILIITITTTTIILISITNIIFMTVPVFIIFLIIITSIILITTNTTTIFIINLSIISVVLIMTITTVIIITIVISGVIFIMTITILFIILIINSIILINLVIVNYLPTESESHIFPFLQVLSSSSGPSAPDPDPPTGSAGQSKVTDLSPPLPTALTTEPPLFYILPVVICKPHCVCRRPLPFISELERLRTEIRLLEIYLDWKHLEPLFWSWMESVIDAKLADPSPPSHTGPVAMAPKSAGVEGGCCQGDTERRGLERLTKMLLMLRVGLRAVRAERGDHAPPRARHRDVGAVTTSEKAEIQERVGRRLHDLTEAYASIPASGGYRLRLQEHPAHQPHRPRKPTSCQADHQGEAQASTVIQELREKEALLLRELERWRRGHREELQERVSGLEGVVLIPPLKR